jgi:hypothetical protein
VTQRKPSGRATPCQGPDNADSGARASMFKVHYFERRATKHLDMFRLGKPANHARNLASHKYLAEALGTFPTEADFVFIGLIG